MQRGKGGGREREAIKGFFLSTPAWEIAYFVCFLALALSFSFSPDISPRPNLISWPIRRRHARARSPRPLLSSFHKRLVFLNETTLYFLTLLPLFALRFPRLLYVKKMGERLIPCRLRCCAAESASCKFLFEQQRNLGTRNYMQQRR